ncbi:EAL domain-containing protein [Pseudoxanthobacter sp. M-2]|uniref:EAL domain-containing protein n=1 Tax=Pseudoxanthobacter sp. M-2 TaxID=3078754 RepID=UPI0038FCC50C
MFSAPYPDNLFLPAGAMLFNEGDEGNAAFLIKSGSIEVFRFRDDCEQVVANLGPGDLLGEMSALDRRPRTAGARATVASELVPITADQIERRIADADPVLRLCLKLATERFREAVAETDTPRIATTARGGELGAAFEMIELEREIDRGLTAGEFELFYQPIVRLADGTLAGCEGLARWRHPKRGLVPPGDFIPAAEASGLIERLTDWCVAEAIGRRDALAGAAGGASGGFFVTVNVSGRDLARPQFATTVGDAVADAGISPASVKLEITESMLMANPDGAAKILNDLRARGLGVAIDDFGTGYSSLSYLATLPITTLKIDRSFVLALADSRVNARIIQTILRLADELGIAAVAEGIEDAAAAATLRQMGCTYGQGYHFARPLPFPDFVAWAQARTAAAPST